MSAENPIDETPDTHSKRLGNTETSRLKAVNRQKTDKDFASSIAVPKPVSKSAPGRTSVVDPMKLRDTSTSKVKRVQAASDSGPQATVSLPGTGDTLKKTETVQLKVVQQKKKELAQNMNPASTVRLKAPGEAAGPSISIPKSAPGTPTRDTMKISLPTLDKKTSVKDASAKPNMENSSTVEVKSGPGVPPAVPASAANEKPATVKTSTTVLERVKPKTKQEASADETASSVASSAGSTVTAAKGNAGRTLKIRGGKSSRTIKVRSGGAAKTVAVEAQPAGSDEAKTVKMDGQPAGLKFKQQKAAKEPTLTVPTPMASVDKKGHPGMLYTLGAAASFVALGVTVYFTLTQTLKYVF